MRTTLSFITTTTTMDPLVKHLKKKKIVFFFFFFFFFFFLLSFKRISSSPSVCVCASVVWDCGRWANDCHSARPEER